uniref:Uncharacterized protein n=1 Tax=Timema tahoe TaxID=61484 RepID=A0A7R9FI92_9NEOP|nr:unnamed protein product [Timema tahoe]
MSLIYVHCYVPGAFLIPFTVMLFLEGIPLFLVELGIGQRMRLGSLGVWNTIHPWLGGIGITSCVVTFFVALYYNVIITWCFFYLFNSFQVEKLLDPKVWLDAATQVFYSFGLAFGSLIAFGSYNTPDNNCVRDVILVSITNAFTAIYASVVVFAILGFKAMTNFDKCLVNNKMKLFQHNLLPNASVSTDIYESTLANLTAINATMDIDLETCDLSQQLNQV